MLWVTLWLFGPSSCCVDILCYLCQGQTVTYILYYQCQGEAVTYIFCYLCQGLAVTYFSSVQNDPSASALQRCSRVISSRRELPACRELPVLRRQQQWPRRPFRSRVVLFRLPWHSPDPCLPSSRRSHLLDHTHRQHRRLHHTRPIRQLLPRPHRQPVLQHPRIPWVRVYIVITVRPLATDCIVFVWVFFLCDHDNSWTTANCLWLMGVFMQWQYCQMWLEQNNAV